MEFLKPIGQETPEANSRCPWLSVVLAPIAPQATKSDMYCGEIKSKYSVAAGTPKVATSTNICLATRKPLLILKLALRSGSLIKPFQPTVVRGFSK